MPSRQFYIMTLGLFLLLTGTRLLATGMFTDGLVYDVVARNMAEGIGSMWDPYYSATCWPHFREHPALSMWLLSLLYRLTGEGIWVAKAYSLLMLGLTMVLTLRLWHYVGGNNRTGWLPLMLLVMIEAITHFGISNILEVAMAPMVLGAVLLTLRASKAEHLWCGWLWLLAGGALLAGAFFTKGFTGLYPLAFPLMLAIVGYGPYGHGNFWNRAARTITDTAYLALGLLLPVITIFLCNKQAWIFFIEYMQKQVLPGIETPVADSRFYIITAFLNRTMVIWLLTIIALAVRYAWKRQGRAAEQPMNRRLAWALALLTLCGVLPIMISLKQRSFYCYTVYPFFATAAAVVIYPIVNQWFKNTSYRLQKGLWMLSIVILLSGIVFQTTCYGKPGRDEVLQSDLAVIATRLEKGERVAIDPSMKSCGSSFYSYAMRDYRLTLDPADESQVLQHLILTTDIDATPYTDKYQKIKLTTTKYTLYELKTLDTSEAQ